MPPQPDMNDTLREWLVSRYPPGSWERAPIYPTYGHLHEQDAAEAAGRKAWIEGVRERLGLVCMGR